MRRNPSFPRRAAGGAVVGAVAVIIVLGAALAAETGTEVVARLGTSDVTAASLGDFVRSLQKDVRKQALADPQFMNRLVRAELARVAVLNEAKSKKWDERPEVVSQVARAIDDTIVKSYLASIATPPADYPSDAEIQSAYDLNRDRFMAPREYKLDQIYVALPADADKKAEDAAQKKAEDLAKKLRAKPGDFAELARANSDHKESAKRGGEMGWAPENEIVPAVRAKVASMADGEISDPIRTPDGWHIIRMVDTKPAAPRPLAEVKDQLAAFLRQRKAQETEEAYLAGLLKKTPVTVNEFALRKIFETVQ
jgi:peptidylprolyl isomerase